MTWQDYKRTTSYGNLSIGLLENTFVLERKIQSGMASNFYIICKAVYDDFSNWCRDEEYVLKIRCEQAWCRGFWGHAEFIVF